MTTNTKSAICFIPPIEQLSYVQSIRSKYDRAYERWMPHMNLFFPFLESDKLEDSVKELEKVLCQVAPFEITFEKFDAFKRKKDATVHLAPQDNGEMAQIYQLICQTLKLEPDKRGFHPHLTVGQFKKGELPMWLTKLTTEFEPHKFSYLCNAVYVIERGDDTPFEIKHVIKLGC